MMYTKGKLTYLRSKKKHEHDLVLYTDAHNLPDGFGIHDEEANAQRLVLCWNEYDDLMSVVKGLAELGTVKSGYSTRALPELVQKAKKLIAKVEGSR